MSIVSDLSGFTVNDDNTPIQDTIGELLRTEPIEAPSTSLLSTGLITANELRENISSAIEDGVRRTVLPGSSWSIVPTDYSPYSLTDNPIVQDRFTEFLTTTDRTVFGNNMRTGVINSLSVPISKSNHYDEDSRRLLDMHMEKRGDDCYLTITYIDIKERQEIKEIYKTSISTNIVQHQNNNNAFNFFNINFNNGEIIDVIKTDL